MNSRYISYIKAVPPLGNGNDGTKWQISWIKVFRKESKRSWRRNDHNPDQQNLEPVLIPDMIPVVEKSD